VKRQLCLFGERHLQPTALGMEVDEFLMRVLPKMVEPEFTEMEGQLDAIASGETSGNLTSSTGTRPTLLRQMWHIGLWVESATSSGNRSPS